MTLLEAIEQRHSVRSYTDKKIEDSVRYCLQETIDDCNMESGLHIQLCLNVPDAFDSAMARYGKFKNVNNFIALVGKKSADFEEKCGYYGEKVVIAAQQLGLRTCWVAMTFNKANSKKAIKFNEGERLLMVISLGYGENNGTPHKSKALEDLYETNGASAPEWFLQGVKSAQLAPTATNQQKFKFILDGTEVNTSAGIGFYTKVDLGIAKYHFDVGKFYAQ